MAGLDNAAGILYRQCVAPAVVNRQLIGRGDFATLVVQAAR